MKNVGIVIRALSIGGAEKQSLLLAKALNNNVKVYLFVQKSLPRESRHIEFIKNENINYIQLNGSISSRLNQLQQHIQSKKINVLFAYLTIDNLLASLVKIFDKNLVVVGGIRNSKLPTHKFLITWILHKFFMDYILFNNVSGKNKFVTKGYSSKKSLVIHNCIDGVKKVESKKIDEVIRIISVGRFVAQKNYFLACKVFSEIIKLNPYKKIIFYIIGYGKQEAAIRNYIDKNKIQNVKMIIKPANLDDYYSKADIYLSSSSFEGLSNTIMEALQYELPVVATDVGDNNILVHNGNNGFLCKPLEDNEMVEKLNVLINNVELRNVFGKNSKKILEKHFSEKKFKENYLTLLDKIL